MSNTFWLAAFDDQTSNSIACAVTKTARRLDYRIASSIDFSTQYQTSEAFEGLYVGTFESVWDRSWEGIIHA